MKKAFIKKLVSLILVVGILCAFAACGNKPKDETTAAAPDTTEQTQETSKLKKTVYIGNDSKGFKSYDITIEGEETPEKYIQAIADLTGWNLKLADVVTTGKGGMTVTFSKESGIITGPPEKQKEEFFVHDNFGFITEVLDSIKETLQKNYVIEPGDPETLPVYFNVEDEAIVVEDKTIPMDEPWSSDMLK